ncbi:hypothetical protein SLE2022_332440 [Rubroshorea leprosula]
MSNCFFRFYGEVRSWKEAKQFNSKGKSYCFSLGSVAAVKFIRSVQAWICETFGIEKTILSVTMATPEDTRINAEHIRIAAQFVEVSGGTNNSNYTIL